MKKIEHEPFQKIPRLNRDMVITEKIDGCNAAVQIHRVDKMNRVSNEDGSLYTLIDPDHRNAILTSDEQFAVFPQSRNRFITTEYDNHGFAQWVYDRADELAETLGEGIHFGEFWGSGIQRGYGLTKDEKRFSLFNTSRWNEENTASVPGLSAVPVLYEGVSFNTDLVNQAAVQLRVNGSKASPGFMKPEGVIVFHTAANSMFKVTCENDQYHKGAQ